MSLKKTRALLEWWAKNAVGAPVGKDAAEALSELDAAERPASAPVDATQDTPWSDGWRDCSRQKNGRLLRVRFVSRGRWSARLVGERRSTVHDTRAAAKRAAERRAVKP